MCDLTTDEGICGRNGEINQIRTFIKSRIEKKKSGILYLTGPPGTGKTMSVNHTLRDVKSVKKLSVNCAKAQSSKGILAYLCRHLDLEKYSKSSELEMIARLTKKFSSRLSEPYILVLDEIDTLKSKSGDLFRRIFSWPEEPNSKLIIIGIANIVNLTSRYISICSILGKDDTHVVKIVFKPYSSKDLKEILQWYVDNDENFADASFEQKALDMIAMRYARDGGDIRGALNALRSVIDDENQQKSEESEPSQPLEISHYPTPPLTPLPSSPCKELKTNITAVASSIKKRSKRTHYKDDAFPFTHQAVLTCIEKLCSKSKNSSVKLQDCKRLSNLLLDNFGLKPSNDDMNSILEHLDGQNLISVDKRRGYGRIILKAGQGELSQLLERREMILNALKKLA